jgi:hypothetical protein
VGTAYRLLSRLFEELSRFLSLEKAAKVSPLRKNNLNACQKTLLHCKNADNTELPNLKVHEAM